MEGALKVETVDLKLEEISRDDQNKNVLPSKSVPDTTEPEAVWIKTEVISDDEGGVNSTHDSRNPDVVWIKTEEEGCTEAPNIGTEVKRENPVDIEAVLSAIMCDTDDESNQENHVVDDSDTDEEDRILEREGDSETELSSQSCSFQDEENNTNQSAFCAIKIRTINKKLSNVCSWQKKPMDKQWRAKRINLLTGVIGLAKNVTSILDSWMCLVTDTIIQSIVDSTNKFILTIRGNYSRSRDAKLTDLMEIKALFGLLYLSGVYRATRLNLEDLWRMDDFKSVMSMSRFHFLMSSLQFDDIQTRSERRQSDRLAPIRYIFEEFVSNCQKCYSLGENVTIDEKLEAFRGRCSFKQHMPKKPSKYGIKMYALVDSQLFYTYNLEIYAGTQPEGPFHISNKPSDVIKRLARPIFLTGKNITADNWFTDYELVKELAENNISYVGTLKKNESQIPRQFKTTRKRAPLTSLFGFQKESTLVSYVPKRNKNILLISSFHKDDKIDEKTGNLKKPEILTYYNLTKGGVDTVDKLCETFNVARNTKRWPLMVFFSIMNVAAINSFIIWIANANNKLSRRKYLRYLSNELVKEHLQRRSNKLTGELLMQQGGKDHQMQDEKGEEQPRKRCKPCKEIKKTRVTRYKCELCKKAICLQHSKNVCADCILSC